MLTRRLRGAAKRGKRRRSTSQARALAKGERPTLPGYDLRRFFSFPEQEGGNRGRGDRNTLGGARPPLPLQHPRERALRTHLRRPLTDRQPEWEGSVHSADAPALPAIVRPADLAVYLN